VVESGRVDDKLSMHAGVVFAGVHVPRVMVLNKARVVLVNRERGSD
jgi:hypothetical protein